MNGFASEEIFIDSFQGWREAHPDWENEWAEKMLDAYQRFNKLSDKQWQILYSIADQIGLKPGWQEDME